MKTSGNSLPVGIRTSGMRPLRRNGGRGRRATAFVWSLLLAIAAALTLSAPALAISASVGGTNGTTLVLRPDAGELFGAQVSTSANEDGWTGEFLLVSSDDPINNGSGCEPWFSSTTISKCRSAADQPAGGITLIDMVGSDLDTTAVNDDRIIISDVDVPSSLVGLAGEDNLSVLSFGAAQADTIDGGDGADSVGGGDGADTISGGLGEDFLRANEGNDPSVSGGPGNDRVIGNDGSDNVSGGDGNDEVFGDDTFQGRPGDGTDTIDGGANDDVLDGGFFADTVTGGTGIDTATYEERNPSTPTGLRVSLDNVQNDGETDSAGNVTENDNVGPDGSIENLTGPFDTENTTVTLIGNDGPNVLDAETLNGVAFLDGRGGNDTFFGAFAVNSTFLGGAGDDEINGTSSNDTMFGGTGVDTLNGFAGSDTLTSSDDGTGGDRVNCGSEADVAFIDFDDFTDGQCESLSSTTPPVPPPGTEPPGGEGGVPLNTFTTANPNGLKLPVTVPGPGVVTVAEAGGKLAAQEGPPKQTMLSLKPSSATATAAGTVDVQLKLARKAKKKYKQGKTVKVQAAVGFTPTGGTTNTTTVSLKLKK